MGTEYRRVAYHNKHWWQAF